MAGSLQRSFCQAPVHLHQLPDALVFSVQSSRCKRMLRAGPEASWLDNLLKSSKMVIKLMRLLRRRFFPTPAEAGSGNKGLLAVCQLLICPQRRSGTVFLNGAAELGIQFCQPCKACLGAGQLIQEQQWWQPAGWLLLPHAFSFCLHGFWQNKMYPWHKVDSRWDKYY